MRGSAVRHADARDNDGDTQFAAHAFVKHGAEKDTGVFVRGFLNIHRAIDSAKLVGNSYQAPSKKSQHYGADEQMAADVIAHVKSGAALPVSALDAIEAGILALAMDEARASHKVIDLAPVWAKYDACLHGTATTSQAQRG